jgi:hypothetical protein
MAQDDAIKEALSMLSSEQLEALRTALGQSSSGGRAKVLSEHQIETLRSEAANYHLAQKRAVEAVGVLWNARLDLAIDTGDVARIDRAMARPVAIYDNCNCLSEASE